MNLNGINLLQYLQCQNKTLNLLDSSQQEIVVTSYTLKAQLPCFAIVHSFSLLYTKLINALIAYLYILKILLCYVDPITKRTYDYATRIACDNNPRNKIELDPDSRDQHFYYLGPEPIKRKPPLMFTPSQIKTTIRPNTFTAQDAGIYSNAELDQLLNRILFSKHSDTTLQLLRKALSYSFISSNTPDYDANSPHETPYNKLRIGLHDKRINRSPLFTPTWLWLSDFFLHCMDTHVTFSINVKYLFYISFHTSNHNTHHKTIENNFK